MKQTLATVVLVLAAACGPNTSPAPVAPPDRPEAGGGEGGGDGARTPTTHFELADGKLVLPGPIVFRTEGDEIELVAGESEAALWYIHDYLVAKDAITLLRLEGHGDEPGERELILSGTRALAVGKWLEARGIDCHRLLAVAFGDSKPVADPSTPEGRARNRRIEAVNAELRGKAIGGMPSDGGGVAARVCD
jgi:OOP family OmpA-OmpF porin